MGLQNDVKHYLSRFGISKSHMAKALNITIQQLSAWTNGKLVLSEYHMDNIRKYVDTMKQVDEFLQVNNLVMQVITASADYYIIQAVVLDVVLLDGTTELLMHCGKGVSVKSFVP